jgi:uncharacterized SAM-binding protein YcdF (DUF218 family)
LTINTVLTALLLPPASLALAAALALALFRGRLGRVLAMLSLIGLILLSLPVVSMALLASLDSPDVAHAAPELSPEAIVVLGGDVSRIPDAPGAVLGSLSLERVRAGAELQRRSGLPVLVSGGLVDDLPLTVGALMAESMASDFGVPVRWTEATSPTTWENAEYSAAILAAAGIRRVYVVTHAWHMRRSLLSFRHFGMQAVAAPVRRDPWPRFRLGEFMPRTQAWVNSFYAMHEWVGLAYYSIRR